MEIVLLLVTVLFVVITISVYRFLKYTKKESLVHEKVIGMLYFFSFLFFTFGLITHNSSYHQAVDIVDGDCYIPFSNEHLFSLLFYLILFNISIFLIWARNGKLPPLTHVLSLIFTFCGVILNFIVFLQVSQHNTDSLTKYHLDEGSYIFILWPLFATLLGIYFLVKIINAEIDKSLNRSFNNRYLAILNDYLSTKYSLSVWAIMLIFPILFICTLILLLFGQDADSLVKVFTETTTWRFSQKMHPPVLDHEGHYICTVAACGNPKLVKPIRLGKRNGSIIIVNRQLQIANAFEEMIWDISPRIHKVIRRNYDKYGYNISTNINSSKASNITYVIMKPLEWMFLISLYSFCQKPEEKIKKQYKF